MRLLASPYLLPVILTLMAGCQDDGGPAAPVAQQVPQDPPAALITGTHVEQAAIGLAHLRLAPGPDGWSAELLPMRFGSVAGDAYLIDVTNFFRKSPCGDCAEVTAVGIESNGQLNVEITAHHPFRAPAADGSPRADLHIFDLMGMVVSNASAGEAQAFAPDNVAVRTSGTVLNADGFSALFDESLENYIQTPAVDAHPYKVFNVDGGPGNYDESFPNGFADLSAPTGRNVFPMGGTAAVTYSLNVPADKEVLWGYALIASYGQSARRRGAALGERQNPKYFLPEFNTKAPWRVTAQFLNNDLTAGTTSSTAQLQVAVRDWQQEAETASNWDFDTTPLGQVRDDSKITGVH
ncbi:MAG TPA: hypothetical protein VEI97_16760, partial [bacterium]|nr:hypothetical protein [bacterium]